MAEIELATAVYLLATLASVFATSVLTGDTSLIVPMAVVFPEPIVPVNSSLYSLMPRFLSIDGECCPTGCVESAQRPARGRLDNLPHASFRVSKHPSRHQLADKLHTISLRLSHQGR